MHISFWRCLHNHKWRVRENLFFISLVSILFQPSTASVSTFISHPTPSQHLHVLLSRVLISQYTQTTNGTGDYLVGSVRVGAHLSLDFLAAAWRTLILLPLSDSNFCFIPFPSLFLTSWFIKENGGLFANCLCIMDFVLPERLTTCHIVKLLAWLFDHNSSLSSLAG